MKKTILLALIVLLLTITSIGSAKAKNYDTNIVANFGALNPVTLQPTKTEITTGISQNDMSALNQNPTPDLIKKYMQTIAPDYGVDWKLVYAIGYHESGNYSSSLARRSNNYFGRKATSGGYASWSTPEEAIQNQFSYIKNNYYSRGLTTPAAINPIYAEDSSWRIAIQAVMNSL